MRWTGFITAPVTGIYTFATLSYNAVSQLSVGGKVVVDNRTKQLQPKSGKIALTAGQVYYLEMLYGVAQNSERQFLMFQWSMPGDETVESDFRQLLVRSQW